ncbi:predicted protein [Plenodomus lingam JN3]|uniref:Predicted protein n=1 Tax=Leptosphaeria maculans (strain JN3 / isolate v23.1.3 / race Av1-4-5-6-7-8) TaxID=985895 RepID=E5A1B6_LEPMJ|nr:predicted protein [Plenodomus lingam JN3]CBX97380.1 predicted protein [Plenodomus lingam JN3]
MEFLHRYMSERPPIHGTSLQTWEYWLLSCLDDEYLLSQRWGPEAIWLPLRSRFAWGKKSVRALIQNISRPINTCARVSSLSETQSRPRDTSTTPFASPPLKQRDYGPRPQQDAARVDRG